MFYVVRLPDAGCGRADTEVTVVAGREFTSGRAIGFHALMLGKMYRDGIALPRNDVAAHKWLDISERWTPNASGWSAESLARDLRPCFLSPS